MGCVGVLLLAIGAVWSSSSPGRNASGRPDPGGTDTRQHVPGQMLVRYRSTAGEAELADFRREQGLERIESVLPGLELVQVAPGRSLRDALHRARDSKHVLRAERNSIYGLHAHGAPRSAPLWESLGKYGTLADLHGEPPKPNDPVFLKDQQWSLKNTGKQYYAKEGSFAAAYGSVPDYYGTWATADADIDAPEAWEITTGSKDVVVAVVDTGLNGTHPDLKDNLWENPGESGGGKEKNGIDDDKNGYVDDFRGWDFSFGDNDPTDKPSGWEWSPKSWLSHGTLVAGVIGAKGDNATDIAGINWDVQLMPLRALGATGNEVGVIKALDYGGKMGADVVNMSFGTGDAEFAAELDSVIAKYPETLFVTSAGNEGGDHAKVDLYPCDLDRDNVICVASTGSGDELSFFSDYGYQDVDIGAPGEEIYSTKQVGTYALSGYVYLAFGSTSGDSFLLVDGSPLENDLVTGGTNDSWGFGNCCGVTDLSDSPAAVAGPDDWADEANEFVDYKPNTNSWAKISGIDLDGSSCAVEVTGQWNLADDKVLIEAKPQGASTWQQVGQLDGKTPGNGDLSSQLGKWVPKQPPPFEALLSAVFNFGYKQAFNLTGMSDKKIDLRFRLVTNAAKQADGIYLNQIMVFCDVAGPPADAWLAENPELFKSVKAVTGTSVATPHVSGVAALVRAVNPDIEGSALRSVLMQTVDKKLSLEDKIKSGGRLNAEKAVKKALPYSFAAGWFTDGKASGIAVNDEWLERVYLSYPTESKLVAGQQKSWDAPYSYQWETWAGEGSGPGEVSAPNDVAIDSGGSVYVSDAGNARVQRFSEKGEFLAQTSGQLVKLPKGIGGASEGRVYVADQGQFGSLSGRISVFDSPFDPYEQDFDLSKLAFSYGWAPVELVPGDVAVVDAGTNLAYVYVLDSAGNKVRKYEKVGKGAANVDELGGYGSAPGKLKGAKGIAVDEAGYVYVADTNNDRVQIFDANGSLFRVIKGSGIEKPMAVAVTEDEVFVLHETVDKADANRVSVFKQSTPQP